MTPLIIAVKQEHLSPLPPSIVAAHLDNPVSGKIIQKEETRISGWVLPKNTNEKISIRIATPFGSFRSELTNSRPDVLSSYKEQIDYDNFVCGFDFSVPFFLDSEIFIHVGNQEYSWALAQVPAPPEVEEEDFGELLRFFSTWRTRSNERPLFFSIASTIEQMTDADFKKKFLDSMQTFIGADAILASAQSPEEKKSITAFLKYWETPDFSFSLLNESASSGQASMRNLLDFSTAYCSTSYNITTTELQNINLLFFCGKDSSFVAIQHVTMVDAIYFPKENKLYALSHFNADVFLNLIPFLKRNLTRVIDFSRPSSTPKFGSLIISANRPFHFYNDTLPALSMLNARGNVDTSLKIYSVGSYYPIEKIYPDRNIVSTPTSDIINSENFQEHSFSLRFSINANLVSSESIKQSDDQLIKTLPLVTTEASLEKISSLKNYFPVVWCGVTGQKRSWVEQVDGLADILNKLMLAWPNLAVVIDGWTSPLQSTPETSIEIGKDLEVAKAVASKLPPGTVKVMTIGMTSAEKIAIGQACDLFIANFGSGSIHVARFARTPGVSHINTRFPRTGHVHAHTIEVPEEFVTDLPAPENTSLDAVSYSVSPDVILRLVVQVLESGICLQRRHRRAGLEAGPLVSWNSSLP